MFDKDKKMIELLNLHYNKELAASNLYVNFATLANKASHPNVAKFMKKLADDKIDAHLSRIYKYFWKLGIELKVDQFSVPTNAYATSSVEAMVKKMFDNEMDIRKNTLMIADYALAIKDYETFEFIQWFVKDAIKDISDVDSIVNLFKDNAKSSILIELAVKEILDEDDDDDEDE